MKQKLIDFYKSVAVVAADMSTARRAKVGAIIVKNNNIISFGYNGTLPGHDNNCEIEIIVTDGELIKEIWDYIMEFPRKKLFDGDSPYHDKHFWYKEKCYVIYKIITSITHCCNHNDLSRIYLPRPTYTDRIYELTTKPEVIHAEQNAIYKLSKGNESAKDADMFITHAPCKHCTNALIMSGIKRIYYSVDYVNNGIPELINSGIEVIKI